METKTSLTKEATTLPSRPAARVLQIDPEQLKALREKGVRELLLVRDEMRRSIELRPEDWDFRVR